MVGGLKLGWVDSVDASSASGCIHFSTGEERKVVDCVAKRKVGNALPAVVYALAFAKRRRLCSKWKVSDALPAVVYALAFAKRRLCSKWKVVDALPAAAFALALAKGRLSCKMEG